MKTKEKRKKQISKFWWICALTVTLLVSGCGGTKSDSNEETEKQTETKKETTETEETVEKEADDNLITFDPAYTVIDDENVKMQIVSLQKEESNIEESYGFIEYSINLYIENKNTEHDIDCTISTTDGYVDGYAVEFRNGDTKTKAGKKNDTAAYSSIIYPNQEQSSSNGSDHIKSLEDLLKFEATVNVTLYDDTGTAMVVVDRYPVDISLSDSNQTTDDDQTSASLELIDGIAFGDTSDQVNEKIKSAENWPEMTTMDTSEKDYFMPGYSCESPDLKWAFKLNIEGYRASVTGVYKGDDGGLVDLYASVADADDSVSKSDVYDGLQEKITDKYGESVANADIEHRKEKTGFAYDAFVDLQAKSNQSVDVEKYSEWDLPEYNAKIEMFLAKVEDREYVFIDYRCQE